MSRLINDTIEAYNLYLEDELSLEDLEYGIKKGLISESLLIELDATMLSEVIQVKTADGWRNATHKEAADFHGDMANFHFANWQDAKNNGDHLEAIQHYRDMKRSLKLQGDHADAHFKETGKDYWSSHLAEKKALKAQAATELKSHGAANGSEHGSGIIDHIHDHAAHYGAAAAGLAAAGAGAYALHKYLKNRKAKKNAEALKQAVNNIKAKKV